jgi:hypothetical protein
VCPYIEQADERCADHLTMRNICHAFAHCVENYASCQVYQALAGEQPYEARPAQLLAAS